MSGNRKNWTLKWCRVQACHLSAEAGWGGAEGTLDSGADPGFFFRRGCTSLLLYFNTNKPHSFFLQNTSCIRKPQVISGGRGGGVCTPCTLPLDPLLLTEEYNFWSALVFVFVRSDDPSTALKKIDFQRRSKLLKTERYLSIISRAPMGSESIGHEPEGRMGYWLRGPDGERNNCFSKIQLVGHISRKNNFS